VTFVALDPHGNRVPVPQVIPETEEEKRRYEDAGKRRAYRCALCGRMPGQGGLFAILCVNAQRPVDLLTKNDRMSEEALRSMGLLFDME